MKKQKHLTLIIALSLPLYLCSCSLENFGYDSESSETERESDTLNYSYDTVDIDDVNEDIRNLLEDIKKPDNEKAVGNDIDILLNYADTASDAMTYKCIESYLDWNNYNLECEYEDLSETFYVVRDAIGYAFAKGSKSQYSELFSELTDEDSIEYYTQKGMNLSRIEGYASVDYNVTDENIDSYFDVAYDDSLSDDEKNIKCAEIYLEILSNIDPENYYENYNRDYTPDDILRLSKKVGEKIKPVVSELYDRLEENKYSDDVFESPVLFDDPLKKLNEYAEKLSADIGKSANRLVNEELYTIASGDNCYTGSFTSDLPTDNTALIYIYTDGSYNDMSAAIHEFGHFHASFSDDTNAYLTETNLDVAEIQSQGMELMFMQFYDEIYGEQSEAMKLIKLCDLADVVVSGFQVGEFEYRALSQAEELTPEEVLKLYKDIMGDDAESYPFYYMSHIFEAPGYYISYGVSALAALDMLDDIRSDPAAALGKYEKIAAVPTNSKKCGFRSSLKECGFRDILTEEYIEELAAELLK